MAVYNYAEGEVNIKIVYYGPGLSGKTTNLEYMYSKLPRENKGKMVSMKTRTDRTLFFDFLPIEVGELAGLKVRFLLYTVPGQVYYNATRKLVLKGVDALVFVADSTPGKMDENIESLENLEENLNEIGLSLSDTPWVIQFNKRDVAGCISAEDMSRELNGRGAPSFEAVALEGKGVYETFEGIARQVFNRLRRELQEKNGPDDGAADGGSGRTEVDAEVVAKSASSGFDSEAGESETSGYAEEREEEHESVSEFVDQVLSDGGESAEDLGMDREGYEEYGHMIELDEAEEGQKPEVAGGEETAVAVSREETQEPAAEKKEEFINDPLVKFADEQSPQAQPEEPLSSEEKAERPSRLVNVELEMTEEEIRDEVPLKVVFDIKVRSSS